MAKPTYKILASLLCVHHGFPTLMRELNLEESHWKSLFSQALSHKILRDCLSALEKISHNAPVAMLKKVRTHHIKSSLLEERLIQDYLAIQKGFREKGVPIFSVKGPALSAQLLGDPKTRQFRDVDAFLSPFEPETFLPLMSEHSYETTDIQGTESQGKIQRFKNIIHHATFVKKGLPLVIELHHKTWKISKAFFPWSVDDLIETALIQQGEWSTLIPEYHFLYLVFHGTTHAWCTLKWVLDIALFLRSDLLDYQKLNGLIIAHGLERQVTLALVICEQLFGQKGEDLLRSEHPILSWLLAFTKRQLREVGKNLEVPPYLFTMVPLFYSRFRPSFWFKLQRFLKFGGESMNDYKTIRKNSPFTFLGTLVRPILVLMRLLKRVFSHLGWIKKQELDHK